MIDLFNQLKAGVIVKFHGPTKTQEARISLSDARTGKRKFFPFDNKYNYPYDQASDILHKSKVRVMWMVHLKDGQLLVCQINKHMHEFWK